MVYQNQDSPFAWQANILAVQLFGVDMVVASSRIRGFYIAGHDMIEVFVGLAVWSFGDFAIYQVPLSPLREILRYAKALVAGGATTMVNIFGPLGWLIVILLGIVIAYWLRNSPLTHSPRGGGSGGNLVWQFQGLS